LKPSIKIKIAMTCQNHASFLIAKLNLERLDFSFINISNCNCRDFAKKKKTKINFAQKKHPYIGVTIKIFFSACFFLKVQL
jgi:hypothetical protein